MSAFSRDKNKNEINLKEIYTESPNKYFDLVDSYLDKLNEKEKKLYNHLHQEISNDNQNIQNIRDNILKIIKIEYKNKNGKKNLDDLSDDEEEKESEGKVLDYIIELKSKIDNITINPIGICETAKLYVKKAKELNLTSELKNLKFFSFTFNTGYYAEPYLGAILNGKMIIELVDDYETYTEYHKKTDHILDLIQKWISKNDEIKKWMEDEEISSLYKFDKDQWTFCIALYYAIENKKPIKGFSAFFPLDGNSTITSFGHHIIYCNDLNKKIVEFEKILSEKKESDNLLDFIMIPIFKEIGDSFEDKFTYNNYTYILANFFQDDNLHLLKKNVVFHPKIVEDSQYSFELNYYDISYDNIIRTIEHIKAIKNKINFELLDKIKKWSVEKKYITDINQSLGKKSTAKLIYRYYTKNNIEILDDSFFYIKKRNIEKYQLHYHIIDKDYLLKSEKKLDMIDILYNSESDEDKIGSDSDDNNFF